MRPARLRNRLSRLCRPGASELASNDVLSMFRSGRARLRRMAAVLSTLGSGRLRQIAAFCRRPDLAVCVEWQRAALTMHWMSRRQPSVLRKLVELFEDVEIVEAVDSIETINDVKIKNRNCTTETRIATTPKY